MFSTLNRKLKQDQPIDPKPRKAPAKSVPKRAKQPAPKKARLDPEVRPVLEITEEQRKQFEEEFADFDFSEDNLDQEQQALQEAEKQKQAGVFAATPNFLGGGGGGGTKLIQWLM